MPRPVISAIRFSPPCVVARLGESPSPLEAFTWAEDPRIFGAGKTVIIPSVSLEVLADGSVEPYIPGSIRFKDGRAIRPVCPFLELTAEVKRGSDRAKWERLTNTLMRDAGISLAQLSFYLVAANRKAQRRTGDPACGFEARLFAEASNHERHALLAWTHVESGLPLVLRDRPIPLGFFQVMRPSPRPSHVGDVCLDTIRVRFTPGRGQVYGPPGATVSQASGSRGRYVIVLPQNRILNPAAQWINYDFNSPPYPPPLPPDTYDGESDVDQNAASFGVVDDTCDVLITATLAARTASLTANGRVFVGPPDFAPDRRPFLSIADDLADRDPRSLPKDVRQATPSEWHDAVADLFRRTAETASLFNLDRARLRQIQINNDRRYENHLGFPKINYETMTVEDRILENKKLLSYDAEVNTLPPAGDEADGAPALPRSEYAKIRHDQLSEPELLLRFLLENRERAREIIRPPFARASELKAAGDLQKPLELRDPRFRRSYAFDMRMPPYMRDADYSALSITRLQWDLLFPDTKEPGSEESARFAQSAYRELSASQQARKLKPRKKRSGVPPE
jgi:hypothetical protein